MIVSLRRRRAVIWKAVIVLAIIWLAFSVFLFSSNTRDDGKESAGSEDKLFWKRNVPKFHAKMKKQEQLLQSEKLGRSDAELEKIVPEPEVEVKLSENRDDPKIGPVPNVMPRPHAADGFGEMGKPVELKDLTDEQKALREKLWKENYLDEYVSDLISLHRTLPDVRPQGCRNLNYSIEKIPKVAVVVCFHNEAFSVLLRTVHSILDRSPSSLLQEVILVDDLSNHEDMGKKLEDYVATLNKVKLVRTKKREGLIRGRLLGAKASSAPILVFLDSHCECTKGWLEPMAYRIYEDERNVVVPVIDVIHDRTLQYQGGPDSSVQVGGFDWNLMFNWHVPPQRITNSLTNDYDPIPSPTMAGGLFAISRAFFERLGTYDAAMDFWGGENLELSFKTWLCGGRLETIPCSHVGHIFRSNSPHKWPGENAVRKNCLRVALVWMDDYAKYYFQRIGEENVKPENYGDISERVALRNKLQCKKFQYFVDNVWPEIFIPDESVALGEIRNEALGNHSCLDMISDHPGQVIKMYGCHGQRGNQFFMYTLSNEIRHDDFCLDYFASETKEIKLQTCHGSGGNQMFVYDHFKHTIYHNVSNTCMEMKKAKDSVFMAPCDALNERQKWRFQTFNSTILMMKDELVKKRRRTL